MKGVALVNYFIGKNQDNNAPISNGNVLAWIQQYDVGCHPVDRITQFFLKYFDMSSSLLDDNGSYVLVKDHNEKVWYDPYGFVQEKLGQIGEIVSLNGTRYVDGYGVYEVVSHKGNTVVKTKTWAPPNTNSLVRSISVKTLRGNQSKASIYPVLHLKNIVQRLDNIFISRISENQWLAVTVFPVIEGISGDIGKAVTGERITIFEHSLLPTPLVFTMPTQLLPGPDYSQPVYQLFAAGESKEQAIRELERTRSEVRQSEQKTLRYWQLRHEQTVDVGPIPEKYDYFWKVSNTLIKMSLQSDGTPIIIGFKPYIGNVWIRDSLWVAATLALAGHLEDAVKALYATLSYLIERPDGNYYFAYNVVTKLPNEHAFENDTTGLILYGIWQVWSLTNESTLLQDMWPIIKQSTEWILNNRDTTGLILPDAGIWETFGPHLDEHFEHMTWTSAISAFGLSKAAIMADAISEHEKANQYREGATELIQAISQHNVHNGIVTRSLESKLLDASVNLFFSEYPIFPKEWLQPTIKAMRQRLEDPFIGGIWRHESLTTEEGDLKPWTGPTFWLGQAFLMANNVNEAWRYFNHNYNNSAFCGLLPELLYSTGRPRGIGLPSYSQSGVIRSLLLYKRLYMPD
ncbi:glycoside hydrolase family 15 protein [Salipaludibacillus sp. LMS25]|uniref:glycoside hydrolase family 15 protein n=1 Tax=Salipaludibacillus sp. LMS25 TaxID=2924031 RepID=UPI0020D015B0|nr:glycoside hydrolase family 15 protein [Salipaludibacillus sp. LMS25]UTR16488.1 glycoside hydrolase family 15 protein [Salipaludibacillus sp. LMS25]